VRAEAAAKSAGPEEEATEEEWDPNYDVEGANGEGAPAESATTSPADTEDDVVVPGPPAEEAVPEATTTEASPDPGIRPASDPASDRPPEHRAG
jgi:hypothetical protein